MRALFTPGMEHRLTVLAQKAAVKAATTKAAKTTKAKTAEDPDRRMTLAFLRNANANTGTNEMYGCQVLYVNLDSWSSSKAKNQTIARTEPPRAVLWTTAHR